MDQDFINIEIPGQGIVSFPASMSEAEINAAAAKLHAEGQRPSSPVGPFTVAGAVPLAAPFVNKAINVGARAAATPLGSKAIAAALPALGLGAAGAPSALTTTAALLGLSQNSAYGPVQKTAQKIAGATAAATRPAIQSLTGKATTAVAQAGRNLTVPAAQLRLPLGTVPAPTSPAPRLGPQISKLLGGGPATRAAATVAKWGKLANVIGMLMDQTGDKSYDSSETTEQRQKRFENEYAQMLLEQASR